MNNEVKKLHPSYVKLRSVNRGAYGKIYLCERISQPSTKCIFPWEKGVNVNGQSNSTMKYVAIKKLKPLRNRIGMDIDTVREMKFLGELSHPNIIELEYIFLKPSKKNPEMNYKSLCFVMEYMVSLRELLDEVAVQNISNEDIQYIMLQILTGLEYLHANIIIHRDLKPENILINSRGIIKLVDFGLARYWQLPMSKQVCTTNYRAPELLFGSDKYGPAVDMWSYGCILAELHLKKPIFPGENEMQTLTKMMNILGTPNEQSWPGYNTMPQIFEFDYRDPLPIHLLIKNMNSDAISLLKKVLKYGIRPNAAKIKDDPYFANVSMNPSEQLIKTIEYILNKKIKK